MIRNDLGDHATPEEIDRQLDYLVDLVQRIQRDLPEVVSALESGEPEDR